jgi:hypothetical protein
LPGYWVRAERGLLIDKIDYCNRSGVTKLRSTKLAAVAAAGGRCVVLRLARVAALAPPRGEGERGGFTTGQFNGEWVDPMSAALIE